MLHVRLANESDLTNVVNLYAKTVRRHNREAFAVMEPQDSEMPRARKFWKGYLEAEEKGVLVAYEEDVFLGFTSFIKETYPEEMYNLSTIYVTDEERTDEIVKSMVRTAGSYFSGLGYNQMCIHLNSPNKNLKELIASMGAEHVCDQGLCYTWTEEWIWKDLQGLLR